MIQCTYVRRMATRSGAVILALAVLGGLQAGAALARAAGTSAPASVNPYSPAYRHPYRHGVFPTTDRLRKMLAWARQHRGSVAASATGIVQPLTFHGGIGGIGVMTGPEKVYLVFYGSQWGAQGKDSHGNVTLAGDPVGEAPYLQRLFKGLGTGGETWSGVMTQYCQGIAKGSHSCPVGNKQHVAYPAGGALAGVWADESAASPAEATAHQLAVEAVNAAAHFGNTTPASNRDAQYVILSPTGTNPDGWRTSGFCAWHSYSGDSSLNGGPAPSPYGDIAFTNMPYVTDAKTDCDENYLSPTGTLNGVSIVEGHEYAETITDPILVRQGPSAMVGGWADSNRLEVGDLPCEPLPGTTGGAVALQLTTGTFAMQPTWANDANGRKGGCEYSHKVVTDFPVTAYITDSGSNTVTPILAATQTAKPAIPAGADPAAIAITPDGKTAYVGPGLYSGTAITPINIATNKADAAIPLASGSYATSIAITPDGKTAYVASSGAGTVTPISTATNTPGSAIAIPGGVNGPMVITPDSKTVYVASGTGAVIPISTATNKAGRAIPVSASPIAMAITPDGQTIYAVTGLNYVTPIRTATNTAAAPIKAASCPAPPPLPDCGLAAIAITSDGKTAYVVNDTTAGSVTPIKVATNKAGAAIQVGDHPDAMVLTPDGKTAYVLNLFSSTVTPISTATNHAGPPITVTNGTYDAAITPDGTILYVTNGAGPHGTVTPIITATNKAGAAIQVASQPTAIAITPY